MESQDQHHSVYQDVYKRQVEEVLKMADLTSSNLRLCQQALICLLYTSHLLSMVDEAHATGVIGKTGGGIVEHYHNTYRPDIVMGTLSKAIGSEGDVYKRQ